VVEAAGVQQLSELEDGGKLALLDIHASSLVPGA